ncbi:three-helix bundle dimerization domain-containing protein [Geodermatophilus sp. SYSU D01186]
MTVVAAGVAPDEDGLLPAPPGASFLDLLAGRVAREYGADPEEVRDLAAAALATFAGARVQAFVPILVEKRVRDVFRTRGTAR